MTQTRRPSWGFIIYMLGMLLIGAYFTFAAVQGDYGVFRSAELRLEARDLRVQLAEVEAEVAAMENLTRRLSDQYLDLDLLDERARDVLGMVRPDEIVIR